MKRELTWFIIAGICAVSTDFLFYFIFKVVLPINIAKGISFILGSVIAFLINKYKAFEKKEFEVREIITFSILYLSTLSANVAVNQLVLFYNASWVLFAFLCATGTSTVLNFIGQKFWVFK